MATGVVDAKVRQLERKAEGSNAEAPERKVQKPEEEAPTGMEEEKKQEEEGKQGVEAMFKSMMDMMKNVTTEAAGMKSEVGDVKAAVKKATATAQEAVETAQRTEGKIADIKTDIETDKKSRDLWQAGIEERLNGSEFVESAEDLKPADPEIQKKIADIEKKIAGMSGTDPWTTYKTPAGGGSGQAVVGNKEQENAVQRSPSEVFLRTRRWTSLRPPSTVLLTESRHTLSRLSPTGRSAPKEEVPGSTVRKLCGNT